MTTATASAPPPPAAPARPPARPFLPKVARPPVPLITSGWARLRLSGVIALAYVLQFGLAILSALYVFLVRQDGELEDQTATPVGYVLSLVILGLIPVLLSLTVVLVYRARARWTWAELGITRLPRTPRERRLWWRSVCVYATALWVSGLLMALLSVLRGSGGYPTPSGAELARVLSIVPQALMAGVGEELLLVAFLVVALERMGAKAPLIYTVAVVLRIAFHIYYGPAVIGLVVWAVAAVWIFRRTRLILPLVIAHTLWDVNALSAEFVPILSGLAILALLIAVVTTGIVHLVTRRQPDPYPEPDAPVPVASAAASTWQPGPWLPAAAVPPPTALPPPGWYPDPVDPRRPRWWDGRGWTHHVG